MRPGPKKGYRQSAEHIEKRKRFGSDHHGWKGDAASEKAGRARALRKFSGGTCVACGSARGERHHVDGDTLNNDASNVVLLCRRCHMSADGRLESFVDLARRNQPKAAAARWGKALLPR